MYIVHASSRKVLDIMFELITFILIHKLVGVLSTTTYVYLVMRYLLNIIEKYNNSNTNITYYMH